MDLYSENAMQQSYNEGEMESDQSAESIAALFAAEDDHIVSSFDHLSVRCDAIALIRQAQFDCNLDPFLVYLAINYVDRFLSKRQTLIEKAWMVRLLSIACLSLASKMNRSNFVLADLQASAGFTANSQSIQRMELMILSSLEWRMRPITPFSFLQFFANFMAPSTPQIIGAIKFHASKIIYKSQNDVKIMASKPSVICCAAVLVAVLEFFPAEFVGFRATVVASNFVNKEKLSECCSLMMEGTIEILSSSETPITVLGRQFSGSETIGSSFDDRDVKKPRIGKNIG